MQQCERLLRMREDSAQWIHPKNIEFTDTFIVRNIYNGEYNDDNSKELLFNNEAEKDK